ncbi:unnamed protein product [Lupinus luteus]|uniref:Uncharacterized protein n=1 Tax=Lupinus luteus TaxID=3873 RepID=A0AAV1VX82_LUPLU
MNNYVNPLQLSFENTDEVTSDTISPIKPKGCYNHAMKTEMIESNNLAPMITKQTITNYREFRKKEKQQSCKRLQNRVKRQLGIKGGEISVYTIASKKSLIHKHTSTRTHNKGKQARKKAQIEV